MVVRWCRIVPDRRSSRSGALRWSQIQALQKWVRRPNERGYTGGASGSVALSDSCGAQCQFAGKRRLRQLLTCTAEIKRKSRSTRFAANRAQG